MNTQKKSAAGTRTALVVLIVALAFFASYRIAGALSGPRTAPTSVAPAPRPASGSAATGSSCACCGGSAGSGEAVEGAAAVEGGVQRLTVDTSNGYNPNMIRLKAGVPAEITFKQASGCLGQVQSADFGFFEDLTSGDKTVSISADALKPGTYGFECGMSMVFGTIIVE